jgi:hypothetical protein
MTDQPTLHPPAPPTRSRPTAWAAYAACALAWLSAVPSLYWALGGTAGLDTAGGAIDELARRCCVAPTRDMVKGRLRS